MKAIDCRAETWEEVIKRVNGLRMEVWRLLWNYGPCTTRALTFKSGSLSVLTIRPRMTELCQLGLARYVGRHKDLWTSEGVYEAVSFVEAEKAFERRKSAAAGQGMLF